MKRALKVLRFQGTTKGLKINFKETKLLQWELNEIKKVKLGDRKIDQVKSFICLESLIR